MEGFRHRQANDACSLSDVQQVWTDGGITLACADCGGLVEMPCPYCDYVRFPNKSGLGMSLHILSHALGRGRRGWWWPIPEQRAGFCVTNDDVSAAREDANHAEE